VSSGFGEAGSDAITSELVVDGLEVPWGVAFIDDDTLLVTERPGRLRLVESGALVAAPVLTLDDVFAESEAGLLGVVLHPDFATNRLFYLYVSTELDDGAENRIDRYVLSEDSTSATFDRTILAGIPAFRVHDGGRLRIGPDGMLYATTGDARSPDDSQNEASLAGKVLRMTLDGERPDDNPFEDSLAFVKGIRNAQGLAWVDDEHLAISDHGPSGEVLARTGHDEVNIAQRGDDLGWPERFGCEQDADRTAPILTFTQAVPPGGLHVVRDGHLDGWDGSIVVGVLGAKHLHRIVLDDDRAVGRHEHYFAGDLPDGLGRVRDVLQGPDGHLYVSTSSCDGRGTCPPDGDAIFRIVAR
jgi:glucose/arabinose dehydrogenase